MYISITSMHCLMKCYRKFFEQCTMLQHSALKQAKSYVVAIKQILPDLREPEIYMASYRSQKEPKNEISWGSKRFQAGNAILLLWP